jgi:DNA-binding IclR family transcriptional regulator
VLISTAHCKLDQAMPDQVQPKTAKKTETRSVKSAERVLDLFEAIGASDDGVSFTQLGQQLGIPKSSLFALLEIIEARGYILLNPVSRKYALGIRTWETGQAFQRNHSVLEYAAVVLEEIVQAVNETAQLARLVGHECVYLAKNESSHPLRLQSEIGMRLQAHATGVGKAIMAVLDDAEINRLYKTDNLPVYTPQTLIDVPALLTDLAETRARGFAVDNAEYTPGVFCLAVPVYKASGTVTTALSVSVPTMRATPKGLARVLEVISRGSCDLSKRLGRIRPDPTLMKLCDPAEAAAAISALTASNRYNMDFVQVPGSVKHSSR